MKSPLSFRATTLAIVLLTSASVSIGARADNPASPAAPSAASPAPEASDSTIVGIVTIDGNVIKVTAGDVKSKLSVLPPQLASAPYDQIYPLLLESVVTERIINYYADQAKIKDKPEYAKMVEECQKGAAQKLYLDGEIAKLATDEELQKTYNEAKKAAPKEEEYDIGIITVKDQKKAKEILKTVTVNTFSAVANKESENKAPDGALKNVRLSELPEAFRDKLKNAAKATILKDIIEISMPDPASNKKMKTYNIVMVQDKRPASFPPFEAVKGEVKRAVNNKLAKDAIEKLKSKAKIELFGLDGKPIDQKADDASKSDVSKAAAAPAA